MRAIKSRTRRPATMAPIAFLLASAVSMPCWSDSASDSFWGGAGSEVVRQIVRGLFSTEAQVWKPGSAHPTKPNVVAAEEANYWRPAEGYVWDDKEQMTVRLQPEDEKQALWALSSIGFIAQSLDLNSANRSEWLETGDSLISAAPDQESRQQIQNTIAWKLASHPDLNIRDGIRALTYAAAACSETDWKNPVYLDTYAAALAEIGNFEEAVLMQEKAIASPDLLDAVGEDEFKEAKARLELYRNNRPFRKMGYAKEKREFAEGFLEGLSQWAEESENASDTPSDSKPDPAKDVTQPESSAK